MLYPKSKQFTERPSYLGYHYAAGGGDLDQAGVHAAGGQEGVPQRPLPHLQGRGEHAHALLGPRPRRAGGE